MMMSIFSGRSRVEVGKQQITSLVDLLLYISLISILVDLGVLFVFELELGFRLFSFLVYLYLYYVSYFG